MELLKLVETTRAKLPVPEDEHAMGIIAAVRNGIKQIGRACDYSTIEILDAQTIVTDEMRSGDYQHLLAVARRYFKLENDTPDMSGEERLHPEQRDQRNYHDESWGG